MTSSVTANIMLRVDDLQMSTTSDIDIIDIEETNNENNYYITSIIQQLSPTPPIPISNNVISPLSNTSNTTKSPSSSNNQIKTV